MHATTTYSSPAGLFTLGSLDSRTLAGMWWEDQKYFKGTMPEEVPEQNGTLPIFTKTKRWLDRYFAGKAPSAASLPLAPVGGEFRQTVWKLLLAIPYGETATYGALAAQTARILNKPKMSARAVGGAVGHNPISIIIPCHRVVGSDGSLTGYAAGLERKVLLLAREGVDLSRLKGAACTAHR